MSNSFIIIEWGWVSSEELIKETSEGVITLWDLHNSSNDAKASFSIILFIIHSK